MTRSSLQQQNLAIAYDTEYMGKGAYMYSLNDSTINILSDNGGITIYEKKPHKTTTDLIELTDDEAFTLYNILKERFYA